MSDDEKLGETLRTIRELAEKSLKAVAEPAGISTAYLLKLEKGQVQNPSPHILHGLAEQLGVDYIDLMRVAGYVVPEQAGASLIAQALNSKNVTDDEMRALAAYLDFIRSNPKGE
ncbi:MAG TPA: helix-turn-helix transcriptional regulator [Mycobacteriales bacterium]|jgi:transcriptional regulator with XRE-family HTH domain|nr:helix-turn-helix transcriptional regulator [Mycobacteriales bacterium]